jgi:hypothetical protein
MAQNVTNGEIVLNVSNSTITLTQSQVQAIGDLPVFLTVLAGMILVIGIIKEIMRNNYITVSVPFPRPKPAPVRNKPNITVQYSPRIPPRPLVGTELDNWDPNIWVNREVSIYKIEGVIGEGGNGYVLKGNYSGRPLAIKILKLYKGKPEEFFKDLALEASNLN